MKNSKLVTGGILVLTFLFIHSLQRDLFHNTYATGTDKKFETTAARGLTSFVNNVETVEQMVFSSILVAVNKVAYVVSDLMGLVMRPPALTKINVVKPKRPCVHPEGVSSASHLYVSPPIVNGPRLPCNNPCPIYPGIAGFSIVC